MIVQYSFVVLLWLLHSVLGAEIGSQCFTPNKELGTCTPIKECKAMVDEIVELNAEAIQFARVSKCDYADEILVCCGTVGHVDENIHVCRTPNGDVGRCQPISSCAPLSDAIQNNVTDISAFVDASNCGYDQEKEEAWVCCGNYSEFLEISPLLPTRPECGFNFRKYHVLGGTVLGTTDFPWLALLGYIDYDGTDAGFKCGGSLINERYVLTAAHCVIINPYENFTLNMVRLGEWQISTEVDCYAYVCADPVVDLSIEKQIVHAGYKRRPKTNDIALLRLEKNVKYSETIKPICLLPLDTPEEPQDTALFDVAGWGLTENETASDFKISVAVPFVPRNICIDALENWGKVQEENLCAGGVKGEDSCQGDSGGPLVGALEFAGRIQYYLEGVVSWGAVCGSSSVPGVYVKVSKYNKWIADNLEPF